MSYCNNIYFINDKLSYVYKMELFFFDKVFLEKIDLLF